MLIVNSKEEAFKLANKLIDWDYEYDSIRSHNAGYPIYHTTRNENAWISDLNQRLEINYADGSHKNIWIDESINSFTVEFTYETTNITLVNVIEVKQDDNYLLIFGTSGEGKIYPFNKIKNLKIYS